MTPRASIITPFYQVVKYLPETLESLTQQTFQNFEVILADDGSTVDYPNPVESFGNRLNIQLLRLPHLGVSAARNAAIEVAEGEVIAFLDADDMWHATKLERQLELLDAHPECDGVYSNIQFLREDGQPMGKTLTDHFGISALPSGELSMLWVAQVVTSSVILRRASVDESGPFRTDLRIAEDWDFFLRKPFVLECAQEPLLLYRRHPKSVGKTTSRDIQDKLTVVQDYFRRHPHRVATESHAAYSQLFFDAFGSALARRRPLQAVIALLRAFLISPRATWRRLAATCRQSLRNVRHARRGHEMEGASQR